MSHSRFQTAISHDRPRGARIVEAYSPKLGRRLQCFGNEVFDQWICLEADPRIQTFCERPAYLSLADGSKRPADFWVKLAGSEMLLTVEWDSQTPTFTIDEIELSVRMVLPAELATARIWISNWMRMLPCITSCRQLIAKSLINSVLKFVAEPKPLSRIEQEFSTGDPTLVRAAIFSLLHQGQLQAPQLHTEPLSYQIFFQAGGPER